MRGSHLAFLRNGVRLRHHPQLLMRHPGTLSFFACIFPLTYQLTTSRFLLDSLFEVFLRRFLRGHLHASSQASSPGFQTETRPQEFTARFSALFLLGFSPPFSWTCFPFSLLLFFPHSLRDPLLFTPLFHTEALSTCFAQPLPSFKGFHFPFFILPIYNRWASAMAVILRPACSTSTVSTRETEADMAFNQFLLF